MAQSSGGPSSLPVGTEVSAKYRGAFCEAKVKTVQRLVKCKVQMKDCQTSILVTDDEIKGHVKLGSVVEVKHPDTGQPVEAVINKLQDNSIYTVYFDDGDERTLRRSQLVLKGDKHFIESETLDNLPLSHPEHFGTPVLQSKKAKKKHEKNDENDSDGDDMGEEESPRRAMYRGRHQELVGKLMLVDLPHRKGSAIPAVVVLPDANSVGEVKNRDQLLVRSFKDGKFSVVTRKDLKEFSRSVAIKNEDKTMRTAFEKALLYNDTGELPVGWNKMDMLGSDVEDEASDEEEAQYASEDEPFEEKDMFVAQLYKFMDDRGTPINKGPCIGNKDLNLYKLFQIVQNMGGYNKVTKEMKWYLVYSKMGLPSLHPNPAHQIKTAYKKYLDAYETFYRKLGSTMGTLSRPSRGRQSSSRGIPNFRGREKSPRSPKPPLDKVKDDASTLSPKEVPTTSVDEDSASVASEESDMTPKRVRRDARKEESKDRKEDTKRKGETPKLKKEDVASKQKKEVSPGPRAKKEEGHKGKKDEPLKGKKEEVVKGKKEDMSKNKKEEDNKGKKEEESSKKEDRKPNRKLKADEDKAGEKDGKKAGRQAQKEEDKKDAKLDKPTDTDLSKKRALLPFSFPFSQLTRRKLLPTVDKKGADGSDQGEKKDPDKNDAPDKKDMPTKKDDKKDGPKKMSTRESKLSEKKEEKIPRTLERRDSRASERKDAAQKARELKEAKFAVSDKKTKGASNEEKKAQKQEKKADVDNGSESEKSENDTDSDQAEPKITAKDLSIGCKLRVKYGRGKNEKIYIAKIVDTGREGSYKTFLVHYAGWNTRYDEWIRPDRVVSILEKTEGDKIKPSPKPISAIKHAGAQRPAAVKSRPTTAAATTPTVFRTPKLGSAKTRATRSSSSELLAVPKTPGQRMTRRGSTALSDSAESNKSSEEPGAGDGEDTTASEVPEDHSQDPSAEEEDEILDVEQEETTKEVKEEERKPLPEEVEMEDEDEEENGSEPETKTDELPDLFPEGEGKKESTDSSDSKAEEKAKLPDVEEKTEPKDTDDETKAVMEDLKSIPKVQEKRERPSVTVANIIEPVNEIVSLVPPVKDEEEEGEKEEDTDDRESDSQDNEEDEESPKLEIDEEKDAYLPPNKTKAGKNEEETLSSSSPSADIPLLKRISIEDEKPPKEPETKSRVLAKGVTNAIGRKRDWSKEGKKSRLSESSTGEIPTLEPMSQPEAPAAALGTSDPSPYDFEEDTEWQPEMLKKWEPVHKVISTLKDSSLGGTEEEEEEEREKKKVKKKAKKKAIIPEGTSEIKTEKDSSIVPSCNAENDSSALSSPSINDASKDKSSIPKKKGRKKREAEMKAEEAGEGSVHSEHSVDSIVDVKPPAAKKRRMKRVSESEKDTRVSGLKKVSKDSENISVLAEVKAPLNAEPLGSEPSSSGGRKKEASVCESQGFEPNLEEPEMATPFDNTPPTTPEHEDNSQPPKGVSSSTTTGPSSSSTSLAKCASESPSDNEVTSTASTDNLDSGVTGQQSESSSTDQDAAPPAPAKKRKQPEEASTAAQQPKKRKKVHGTRSRTAKKSPKYSTLDSMAYRMTDSQGSSSTTPNHCPDSPANPLIKSPRPPKYNFNEDLGEHLEGEERCNFLISKMKEIRSIYMNLKSEVASIDRRRKRARRKERDSCQSLRGERESST